ncbi:copper resistance protein B [Paraglaciecola agarilytica]|uniref:copper resistance protein B n=1 Tax=Paraglaciecola chathamensis TaxID=368405 RepID=UPI001C09806D|nr:copper resistance protein B [Paraglaciecola agarilytica]MBU3018235.1 copper resistance protein B [Paraglaciecola agarilytica]
MNKLTISTSLKLALLLSLPLTVLPTFAQSDMAAMEEQDMQPQGGDAPKNARDPHAYSEGTTLTEGPYALTGVDRLTLADEHRFYAVLGDRLEYNEFNDSGVFDLQAWYGTTFDRLVIKTEGDISDGKLEENQTDILWSHAISAYWNTQVGVRADYFEAGQNRQWLAFGLQGLAPYWFELDMTTYLGEQGNTAFALEAEYELLLTQKLIIQPRAELTFFGKDDQENALGSGLSSSAVGVRVRYEFTRQFAPYIGVEWTNLYGNTADFAQLDGQSASNTEFVAGIKFWF